MTFPFGAYVVRRRHRPLHRRDQGAALLRARRLRHAHQPDDHRGPDPRRPDRGLRGRVRPGDSVRRERQPPRQQPDGLLPADRRGNAALGDRPHRDAVAAPSDRRQGRGRIAARRRHPVLQQRRHRRLRAPRRDAHGHAAHAPTGSGSSARPWASTSASSSRPWTVAHEGRAREVVSDAGARRRPRGRSCRTSRRSPAACRGRRSPNVSTTAATRAR